MDRLWTPWRFDYIRNADQAASCVFCQILNETRDAANLLLFRGGNSFVILNLFPYTSGHLLVVANRHISFLSDASPEELHEIIELGRKCENALAAGISSGWIQFGIQSRPGGRRRRRASSAHARAAALGREIRILFPLWVKPASFLRNCPTPIKDCFPTFKNFTALLREFTVIPAAAAPRLNRTTNSLVL